MLSRVLGACGRSLEEFHRCVEAHPRTWDVHCQGRREALFRCATQQQQQGAEVLTLRVHCAPLMLVYERCVRGVHSPGTEPQQGGKGDECAGELRSLWGCLEAFTGEPSTATQ